MTIETQPSPDGVSAVARSRTHLTGRQKVLILAGIGGVALATVVATHLLPSRGKAAPEELAGSGTSLPFSRPAEPVARPAPPVPLPTQQAALAVPMFANPAPAVPVKDAALDSSMFSYSGGGSDGAGPAALVKSAAGDENGGKDALTAALVHSDLGVAKAHRMVHPSLTLPAGTVIECTLQTAINSQLMGFATCLTASKAMSADGTVDLLPRGTQVMGEVRSGLREGQDRLFLLWMRARTPDNITVSLDSPAADELGRSGIPGDVNDHFWKRFGAALLFSVIEAAPQVATSAIQSNQQIGSYTQFYSPSQSLAGTILNDTINIPPTLEVNQGVNVSIMVARDLDFSGVYDLVTK